MTREEAVKNLKGAIKKPNTEDGYLGQAITMAIRSLEAWDNLEKEMEEEIYSYDAFPDIWYGISEAYDIVKKYLKEVQGE